MTKILLTTSDIVLSAHVSATTVRNWVLSGRLPVAAETANGLRLFEPDAVHTLIENRRQALMASAAGDSIDRKKAAAGDE